LDTSLNIGSPRGKQGKFGKVPEKQRFRRS
jgi:hypothetical protein